MRNLKVFIIKSYIILIVLFIMIPLLTHCRSEEKHDNHQIEQNIQWWTCSMHPQIKLNKPGKCPICGMDLIPLKEDIDKSDSDSRQIRLTPYAKKLADIQTIIVTKSDKDVEVKLSGKIDYDETHIKHISANVSGRLEKLFVDSTGISLRAGDHLFEIYSPEILTTHQELIQAKQVIHKDSGQENNILQGSTQNMIESIRHKLSLWGLSSDQIQKLENSERANDRITIYAPIGGVVIEKNGVEGKFVSAGEKIYSIADLSSLWLKLEAFESDIPWIHYGQKVEFTIEAYPGETFSGRVSFLSPVVNPETRTVSLRVNVENKKGRMKPNMLAKATLRAKVNNEHKIIDDDLAGKFICPMHPEIIKSQKGTCDICGMDLVKASSFGYVNKKADENSQITIPSSAILFTGKRSIVYVEVPNADTPTYQGREIILGARAGDSYVVKSGIEEGEKVVINGNFKIDSALQIQAKPSMMNIETEKDIIKNKSDSIITRDNISKNHQNDNEIMTKTIQDIISSYLLFSDSLSSDQLEQTKANYVTLKSIIALVNEENKAYNDFSSLKKIFSASEHLHSIEQYRNIFAQVSQSVIDLAKKHKNLVNQSLYIAHCPMAQEGMGAEWLQNFKNIKNPYFGHSMLECGSITETIR